MQIFRRSNLPWTDASAHPSKAPRDQQVRAWVKNEKLHKKETEPVARAIEKALDRKTDTLDLSLATARMLESLPSSLLIRLQEPRKRLILPVNCPPGLAASLKIDIRPTRIEPQALERAIENYQYARHPRAKLAPVAKLLTRPPAAAPAPSPVGELSDNVPRPRESVAKTMHARDPIYDVPPKRNDPVYDVPPKRGDPIYDVPAKRGGGIYDVPPKRSGGIYETPGSNLRDRPAHANQPAIGRARQSADDSGYMSPSPAITAHPIYENQPSSLQQVSLRQREPINRPAPQPRQLSTEAEIDKAWRAVRLLEAWSKNHANREGPDPRCSMSSVDADAVASVLVQTPRQLLTEKQRLLFISAQGILAKRLPNTRMEITPERIAPLVDAMNVVRNLASEAGHKEPPLPNRPQTPRGRAPGG
ncbi:hypothetical protein [Roseateles sp.]|uniref:hypothetical protein n=1 Tax=Roseateles sp. TaxID=1971397 RepID=UPI0031D4B4D1